MGPLKEVALLRGDNATLTAALSGPLLRERSWLIRFAMESVGLLLYAAALAMTELALVQSIAAGGIGAFASARLAGRRLRRREMIGVLISIFGLARAWCIASRWK